MSDKDFNLSKAIHDMNADISSLGQGLELLSDRMKKHNLDQDEKLILELSFKKSKELIDTWTNIKNYLKNS